MAAIIVGTPNAWSARTTSADFAVRARAESVELDGREALAATLKLRGTFKHNLTDSLAATLQIDHVESSLEHRHSDGVTLRSDPVIADPEGTEINQAHVRLDSGNTRITLGRQIITLGDHRFIGDVAFRQNDQTFDALQVNHKTLGGIELSYAYANKVHRIFGDRAGRRLSRSDLRFTALGGVRPAGQLGEHDIDAHFVSAKTDVFDYITATTFAHSVHNRDASGLSHRTVGASAEFRYKTGRTKWQGSLTAAHQERQDVIGRPRVRFYRWELGAEVRPWLLSVRRARFGTSNGQAFQTPFATLHKFQGWTDQFLITPGEGLIDTSVRFMWRKRPFVVDFRFHDFDTVRRNRPIGSEWNADLIYAPNREHELKLRYAHFRSSGASSIRAGEVRKVFLMYSYNLE